MSLGGNELIEDQMMGPFRWQFSSTILICWKFHCAFIQILMMWPLPNCAHDMTAVLLWHVQSFVAICWPVIELQQITAQQILSNMNCDLKKEIVNDMPNYGLPNLRILFSLLILLSLTADGRSNISVFDKTSYPSVEIWMRISYLKFDRWLGNSVLKQPAVKPLL